MSTKPFITTGYMCFGDYIDVARIPDQATFDAVRSALAEQSVSFPSTPWSPEDLGRDTRFLVLHKYGNSGRNLSWTTTRPDVGEEFPLEKLGISGIAVPSSPSSYADQVADTQEDHIDVVDNPVPVPDRTRDIQILVEYILPTLSLEQLQDLARDAIIEDPDRLKAVSGSPWHKVKTDREISRLWKANGNKVAAIKLARKEYGLGLKDAKLYVEAL